MIDIELFVKEFLALKANCEELAKRITVLENEVANLKEGGDW